MAYPSRNTRARRGRAGFGLSIVCLAACGQSDGTRLAAGDAGPSGGGGQGADPGGLEVLYEGEDAPHGVALDERYLYWASGVGVRRAPIDGGDPVTLL